MKSKKLFKSVLIAGFLMACANGQAQVGIGTTNPNGSAVLDVSSTTKGFLPPRMSTADRDLISSPAIGLVIYNTTTNRLEVRNTATTWLSLASIDGSETLTNKTLSSPSFTTPVLGTATATSINKVAITAPTSSATLTIANGKTLTANNTIILAGTDGTTMTFPSSSSTLVSLAGSETMTNKTINGNNNFISNVNLSSQVTGTLPVANGGTGATQTTGTGNNVLSNSPTFTGSTYFNGNVGIGRSTPDVPLHVMGGTNQTYTYRHYGPSYYGITGSDQGSYSIYSENYIRALGFNAVSDARIKRDVVKQNTANQLSILNQLNVVNYAYIDKLVNGNKTKIGFIAQQVEAVNPEFVNRSSDFIPSVFAMAKSVVIDQGILRVETDKPHGFEKGDAVKLFAEGKKETIINVEEVIGSNAFSVNGWTAPTNDLFVYGKKVSDYRAIDFDQISALNVAAIQELSKQIDALKAENAKLKMNMVQPSALDELKKEITLLKASIRRRKNK